MADSAAAFVPADHHLRVLREAAQGCRGCPLYANATQTVFGEGPAHPELVMVGEQPGDQEDRQGKPFVGPAGQLLDDALEKAGIDRKRVYVTNAVKHFKWKPQGKRRLHEKPNAREMAACRPWLEAELDSFRSHARGGSTRSLRVVALGATAAQTLLGPAFRVTKQRGEWLPGPEGVDILATVHPSSILRALPQDRDEAFAAFVADLKKVAAVLK